MKKEIKILLAVIGALLAGAMGCVGYHAYDVHANGFEETAYVVCPEETAAFAIHFNGENYDWRAGDTQIVQLGEPGEGTVMGLEPGETTVVAHHGIHRYKCHVTVREHSYIDADCLTPQTCELCSHVVGEALGHDSSKPTCTEPGVCSRCAQEVEAALGHVEKISGCLEPVICSRCKEEIGNAPGHDFAKATCTLPEICTRCQEESGEPLGHDFAEATCTKPATCKRCKETKGKELGHDLKKIVCLEAPICNRCGETVGDAPGHDFAQATCTAPKTCKRCNLQEGEALGHDYAEATCELPAVCRRCNGTQGAALGHNYQKVESGTEGNQNYDKYLCAVCGKEYMEYYAASPDESAVYNAMIALKSSYPNGTPWDNSNYYAWKGGTYSGGYGCAGFAFMLSDAAFGTARASIYHDASAVRVGDIVRLDGDTHSVIILEVQSDCVIVAEGNYNGGVHWGRRISMGNLASASYFMTRY